MSTRRAAMTGPVAVLLGGLLPGIVQGQAGRALAVPSSLAAELERAIASRKALLIMVSLHGCPYCKMVRESYLVPLRSAGQPMVQIEIAGSIPLLDLHGRASTHQKVARAFEVRVAPTVLFIGRSGTQVASPLVGIASADFYGAYLDGKIATANAAVAG